ncbi:family 16 glycosylhydrolase [Ferruginibacter paludis]|uniref:family 16 glycosylhydrolase n=1 Tax=Ferruginibacter paludis TaxID=1310417 RepID=UPI0025B59ACE|nr:family 16 glycosylhydrolase [Ferruginibacter paludis]MDN3655280.1 family 16 glycosylhydrolase [Ferruginibacter paludis]
MMKHKKNTSVLLLILLSLLSCKKAGADNGTSTAPTNLVINAVVSSDGSGKVDFTASANNAVSYAYEFGNGDIKTTASGIIAYQYNAGGTNTYTVNVTATSSSSLTVKTSIQVTVTVTASEPKLVWSEEFDKDGAPDPAKWGYDIGTGNNGWGNSELEYYTDRSKNAVVEGGVLKINALKENYNGSAYTSARLLSKDKFAFTYGKVEVRAKLPAGAGTWPAIWMLGSDIATNGWPGCGEIDIMEHLGRTENTIYGTLHYPGHSGGSADGHTTVITDATKAFHIYTLEWTASAVKIYADGVLYHTTINSGSLPFNHDFFLILNVAMGGGFGGSVDPSFTNGTMEVDYIRVYK